MNETNRHPPRNADTNRKRSDCISRSVMGHFDKEGNNVIHQSTFLPMIHDNFKTEHMKNCDLLEFKLGRCAMGNSGLGVAYFRCGDTMQDTSLSYLSMFS